MNLVKANEPWLDSVPANWTSSRRRKETLCMWPKVTGVTEPNPPESGANEPKTKETI
jgi:hypothetical protein